MGCRVEIERVPGNLPLRNDPNLATLFRRNAEHLFGARCFRKHPHRGGSTDAGDLSQLMPLLHPVVIGAQGDPHSRAWHIADFECGYVAPAKLLAMMAIDLLFDEAAGAQAVLDALGTMLERRLAAILEADLVGFSRLMAADEAGTHARIKMLHEGFIEPLVAEHRGRVVKTAGDGFLCEFASVVDAVGCALAWQEGMTEGQVVEPEDQRFRFRIGINVGDVIVDGDDLFGDGVNIAARLEALADTGGIFVSSDAYRQVKGKVDATFEDLGERELKNIPEPIRIYRVRPPGADPTASSSLAASPLALPSKPSIAVLPFANRSGDPEQEYFSDGITEDIITALSRIRWFFVIARNSSFSYKGKAYDAKQVAGELGVRYVLEGSVRRAGNRVRVIAELVDGTSGHQLWARRYDRGIEDIFGAQDDITETIVGAIEPELSKVERVRAKSRKPGNLNAWDLYQRGMSHLYQFTREDLAEAKQIFEQAIEIDPGLAPTHSGLAEADYYELVYGYAESNAANRERAIEHSRRAAALDIEDAGAHSTLGRIHYMRREHADAILELEAALRINPSLAVAHYGIGAALVFSGRASEALSHLEAAMRLSPHDPNMGSFLVRLADAYFLTGRFEDAVEWAKKSLQQPNFQWSRHAVLLASLGELERLDEAEACRNELLKQRPDFSIDFVRETHLFADSSDLDRYLEGLRHAGVAESSDI